MKKWIIKLLGGFTRNEYFEVEGRWLRASNRYIDCQAALEQSRKNDTPRDPKTGKFVKK